MKVLRFRWAFYYDDNSYKYGIWDHEGMEMVDKWQYQKLHKMVRAEIHTRHFKSNQIDVIESCPRSEFEGIEYFGLASMNLSPNKGNTFKLPSRTVGIRMRKRNGSTVDVFVNGQIERKR